MRDENFSFQEYLKICAPVMSSKNGIYRKIHIKYKIDKNMLNIQNISKNYYIYSYLFINLLFL